MRVVSWNVNGIRAGVRHGFVNFVDRSGADIVGVQEVRARPEDIPPAARRPPGWHTAFTVAERLGYSGVGLYSKLQPVRVEPSLGVPRFDREGRFMAGHFQTARRRFVVVNDYFPKGSGPAQDSLDGDEAESSIRFSLGFGTCDADVEEAVGLIEETLGV